MRRSLLVRIAVCVGLATGTTPSSGGGSARSGAPIDAVDPRIGVASENSVIGPCLPGGSIHPSPQTPDTFDEPSMKPGNDGYSPSAPIIGFAQLHAGGTGGTPSYGQILLSPQVGAMETDPDVHGSEKSDEIARAAYYAVTLDRYGVRCEVTPAHHVAAYRFTFPDDAVPSLVLNVGRKIRGPSLTTGTVEIEPGERRVVGSGRYENNWTGAAFDLYYAVEASVPFVSYGTFVESLTHAERTRETRTTSTPTERFGAYLRFSRVSPRVIDVRVAVSFHSIDRALEWLDTESGGRAFDEIRSSAREEWSDTLGRITLDGASATDETIFYTALLRSFAQPRDRTRDIAGLDDRAVFWDDHYTMWDTYRTVWPLRTLIDPASVASALAGFRTIFDRDGRVGTAVVGGRMVPADHQGGTEVDNIIADAFAKGVEGVDWTSLYEIVRHDATEVRPESYLAAGYVAVESSHISGSATLGMAHNDFGAYRMACAMGRSDEAARFREQALHWRNLWDESAESDGFTGFIRPRNEGGAFLGGADAYDGFYEASSWTYSLAVPHDVYELIDRCGGATQFNERLVHGFETERFDYHNEPAFLVPWLHIYARRPDLCASRVRELLEHYTTERYPGQEDAGAQASRYVFAKMGFFPVAGQPLYLLHGTSFPRVTLSLGADRTFVIEGKNAGPAAPYVRWATLNGVPLSRAWLTHGEVVAGGTLVFEMAGTPSRWGMEEPPPPAFDLGMCAAVSPPGLLRVWPVPSAGGVRFRTGQSGPVALRLYDVAGRLVRALSRPAGSPSGAVLVWDGRTEGGRPLPGGIYLYDAEVGGARSRGRVVLVGR